MTFTKCAIAFGLGVGLVYFAERHETVQLFVCSVLLGSVLVQAIAQDRVQVDLERELDDAIFTLESLLHPPKKLSKQDKLLRNLPPFPFKANDPKFKL